MKFSHTVAAAVFPIALGFLSTVTAGPLEDLLPVPRAVEARTGVLSSDAVTVTRGAVPGAPADVAAEAYVLEIAPKGATITASDPRGERYARVTLEQLKTLAGGKAPCCRIVDWPALRWRGFMNDCGRNYLDFDAVKACVDVMAKYKMNLFHWHLADYHGWRLESKKYPQLQRKEAFLRQIGKFYTQAEFRELVAYAAARGVTVMPELDVPGHTLALRRGLGIESMAAPGTDKVVDELFEELCSLAPAEAMPFIHLGTDEVRVKPEYCPDEWVSRWARTVNRLGRTAVVWAPGKKLDADVRRVDMAWYDNHVTNSTGVVLDSARMYNGGWNPFMVAPRAAYTKACRWDVAPGRQIGAITCTWHDDNCGDDNTRLFRDCMVFPSILAFADNYWRGRAADHMELWYRVPRAGTAHHDLLADLERRLAAQRDAVFADFRHPFPFLRQTQMRWRLTDEKGETILSDVPQGWLQINGEKGAPGLVDEKKTGCVTAETWIRSPVEQDVGAWIDFTCFGSAYGRTSPTPDVGEWNKHGAKAVLNGAEIAPPKWAQPNMKATKPQICDQDVPWTNDLFDQPFADEGCARREPTPIHLKKGWNHVKLVMPKKAGGSKWVGLFSPLLGTSAHPREVPGLEYSAEPPSCTVRTVEELQAALDAAAKDPAAPRTIALAAGDYFLAKPLELGPAHSNVTVRGAGADRTTLYGGIPVTGWTKEEGTPFWQARLPDAKPGAYAFRTLIKDGALAPIATFPGGTNRFEHLGQFKVRIMSSLQGGWQRRPTLEERTKMPYRPADLPDSMDLGNADIRLYHMWSDSLCTVSNVDLATHTLWTAQPAAWAMGAGDRRKYEVLNVREGMKEPGQWYLDRKSGTVHYWPKPGEDVAKLRFVAPTLPCVVSVGTGRQRWNRKTWTADVTLADFSVMASAPAVTEMVSFGGSAITPALRADCVTRFRAEGIHVANVGGAGIALTDATRSRVANCDVRDVGARGMALGGWSGCGDNCVLSNRICDVGRVYRSSCGLNAGGTNGVIRANEICRIPYCGIIGGGADNLYENNYIHHVMQVLHDGGAIYGNLTRCVLRGNVVHDVVPDGKGYGVHAYYADEGSRDCLVENNYAEGVGTPIHNHMTYRTVVRNNTLVFKGDMRISFARSFDCAFSNNTLVCGGALSVGDPDAVPNWENNFAVRPSNPKDALSRRAIGLWNPERPQQKAKWTMSAERVAAPPTLDGVFGPKEWPLTWAALDRTADRRTSGFTGATCRFAWDDANLYVSLMAAAFKNSRMSVGGTWGKDDGVEIVFAGGRRIRAYYSGEKEILPAAFAAAGVKVWAGRDPKATKPWENQNKANYEIAIPWSALGLSPKAGLKIPFNACAYMSEFDQYKYWEGTAPYPDGRAAAEPAGMVVLVGGK